MKFVSLEANKTNFAELLADRDIHDALREKAMLDSSFGLTIAALLAENADLDIHDVLREKAMLDWGFGLTLAKLLADSADLDIHDVVRDTAMLDWSLGLTKASLTRNKSGNIESNAASANEQTHQASSASLAPC